MTCMYSPGTVKNGHYNHRIVLEVINVSAIVPSAYKLIIEDTREGMLVPGAQSQVVKLNPAAERMPGIQASLDVVSLEDGVGGERMSLETLLDRADQAMYASKRTGCSRMPVRQKYMKENDSIDAD